MPQPDILCQLNLDPSLWQIIEAAPLPILSNPAICQGTTSKVVAVLKQLGLAGTSSEAALWLLAGQLERSHSVSQELHDEDGSYWHGIMHRYEGDYWNAKYWMRHASGHCVRQQLSNQVMQHSEQLLQSALPSDQTQPTQVQLKLNSPETVAESLIDLVEHAITKQTEWTSMLQMICWWEWQLLFQHSYNRQL